MTNGMHVYGWPINTRVALYDWNRRRSVGASTEIRSRGEAKRHVEDNPRRAQHHQAERRKGAFKDSRSFADIVSRKKRETKGEWVEVKHIKQKDPKGGQPCPGMVRITEGTESFPIQIEQDASPVDSSWLADILDLNFEDPIFEASSSDENYRSISKTKSKGDGCVSEKYKEKGKKPVIRRTKAKGAPYQCLNGKLVLDKREGKGRWSTSSDSEPEEGEVGEMTFYRGECSNFKTVGQPSKGAQCFKSSDGLGNGPCRPKASLPKDSIVNSVVSPAGSEKEAFSSEGPSLDARHKEQHLIYFSDLEGRPLSMPLRGPVQLPLQAVKGGQISGKDLLEIPVVVDLTSGDSRIPTQAGAPERYQLSDKEMDQSCDSGRKDSNSTTFYWNLEEEIAKVIEKGVALGLVVNSKDKSLGNGNGTHPTEGRHLEEDHPAEATDQDWNLEEEVTKVIEVGVSLGFDFNGKEVEIGGKIADREKEDAERMAAAYAS
ncbi:hypothetical protein Q3G72_023248 [Acer saccharum]|nr:hypothetical protein Q3G72_023248 [Acer saccharum]